MLHQIKNSIMIIRNRVKRMSLTETVRTQYLYRAMYEFELGKRNNLVAVI
jgi:hypothetical protein